MNNDKKLFFDAGPIITLVMARLSWILPKLKERYGGKFYITPAVKFELVDRPLTIRRFEFEALQVMKLIRDGVLEVYDKVPSKEVTRLIKLANGAFWMKHKTMDVLQKGEVESVTSALDTNADAVVMDERTLRLLIEDNKSMKSLMERRFKTKIKTDPERMDKFSNQLKKISIIRSIELVSVAYKMGLLDSYIPRGKRGKEILLDSVLWAAKYNGCAVTDHEIAELKKSLL